MPGLLDYGREYMPGTDQRSALEQLRGLLSVGAPAAQAVGGLLGYTPGQGQALANERAAMNARLAANPGQRLSSLFPPTEPMPASEQFGAGLVGNFMAPIKAYHGSPHVFDRFDMSKIGTGEGAQAYGYGLYFAENQGVADSYRTAGASSGMSPVKIDGRPVSELKSEMPVAEWIDSYGDVKTTIAALSGRKQHIVDEINKLIKDGRLKEDVGALYTTTLDVEPEDLLDWDKPLSDLGTRAREALAKVAGDVDRADPGSYLPKYLAEGRATGETFYRGLIGDLRADGDTPAQAAAKASAMLRAAGIPGLRYLDAGSRTAGDGSRNIVMFDDSLIRIDERNGKPLGLLTP